MTTILATTEPLYVRGRRRPGPNSYGYDPAAPALFPSQRVAFTKPPPDWLAGTVTFLGDHDVWMHRRRTLEPLRMRQRRGDDGKMTPYRPEGDRRPNGFHRSAQTRVLQVLLERCNRFTGEVGRWSTYHNEKTGESGLYLAGHLDREEIAAAAGMTLTQLDEVLGHLSPAGLIERRQRRKAKGRVARTKIILSALFAMLPNELGAAWARATGIVKPPADPAPAPTPPPDDGLTDAERVARKHAELRAEAEESAAAAAERRARWGEPPPTKR